MYMYVQYMTVLIIRDMYSGETGNNGETSNNEGKRKSCFNKNNSLYPITTTITTL